MSKKGTLPVNESWHLRQISKISILPVRQSCALIEQEMLSTAFGKIIAVYGHIDENGPVVRKWPARKMPITDKLVKNGRLSVKIQVFRTLLYEQMFQKAGHARKSSS